MSATGRATRIDGSRGRLCFMLISIPIYEHLLMTLSA